MNTVQLRASISSFLSLTPPLEHSRAVVHTEVQEAGYSRKLVSYEAAGGLVPAFLFEPAGARRELALVALHQHNGQWHLGKSEIAGLAGDPLQAFGPVLARAGVTVLAPDSVGFESRRDGAEGADAAFLAPVLHPQRGGTEGDWLQYYNQAMHRVVRGDLLIRRILLDVAGAVTALRAAVPCTTVGVLGHSFGGNTALFAAALDPRIGLAVSSGAACSYRHKFAHGVGLEMALVIPGFAAHFDFDDLMRCIAPRRLFIVSAESDPYSADATDLVERAREAWLGVDAEKNLQHLRVPGMHALDQDRFDAIVKWVLSH